MSALKAPNTAERIISGPMSSPRRPLYRPRRHPASSSGADSFTAFLPPPLLTRRRLVSAARAPPPPPPSAAGGGGANPTARAWPVYEHQDSARYPKVSRHSLARRDKVGRGGARREEAGGGGREVGARWLSSLAMRRLIARIGASYGVFYSACSVGGERPRSPESTGRFYTVSSRWVSV